MKKTKLMLKVFTSTILILCLLFSFKSNSQIPTPESHFGFTPGADRMLFNYESLISYMEKIEEASTMVKNGKNWKIASWETNVCSFYFL